MDYIKIYNDLILRGKNRIIDKNTYVENHHIIPKSLGGSNCKDNIVSLTAREHFIAHKILCEIYPNSFEMYNAYKFMMNGKSKNQMRQYKYSSKEYERVKIRLSELQSQKYMGENNHRYGKDSWNKGKKGSHSSWVNKTNHSEETILKMSENSKGEKNGFYGKKHSMELKINRGIKVLIDNVEYYGIREAARIIGVTNKTISNRCKNNKIENYQFI